MEFSEISNFVISGRGIYCSVQYFNQEFKEDLLKLIHGEFDKQHYNTLGQKASERYIVSNGFFIDDMTLNYKIHQSEMITDLTWEFTSDTENDEHYIIEINKHKSPLSNQTVLLTQINFQKGINEIPLKLKKNFHSADLTFRCIETDSGDFVGEITYDSDLVGGKYCDFAQFSIESVILDNEKFMVESLVANESILSVYLMDYERPENKFKINDSFKRKTKLISLQKFEIKSILF